METDIDQLIEQLKDGDYLINLRAAEELEQLRDVRALPALIETVAFETDEQGLLETIERHARAGEYGLAFAVAERDGGEIADLRLACIRALANIAHPEAIAALQRIVNDEREKRTWIRDVARIALEKME